MRSALSPSAQSASQLGNSFAFKTDRTKGARPIHPSSRRKDAPPSSPDAPMTQHWTRWYGHRRWRSMRAHQLASQPLCAMCKLDGKAEPATVVDHVERHFGDPEKFWKGELQSVCRNCHEVRKKFIESRGYAKDVDPETGWPKDTQHPANLPRKAFRRFGFQIPHNLQPSAVPVILVCGPPAAGKTTWVNANKRPGDTVISLDECKVRVGGRMWDTDRSIWRRALAYRDTMLRALARQTRGRAFVVVGAPTHGEREAWCAALGIEDERSVIIMATDAETCIIRLRSDPARAHAVPDLINGVQRWHYLARQSSPSVVVPRSRQWPTMADNPPSLPS